MEPRRISNLKASQRVSVELSSPEMRIRSQSVDGDAEVQWHQDQHSACSVWVGYPQAVQKILATQPRLSCSNNPFHTTLLRCRRGAGKNHVWAKTLHPTGEIPKRAYADPLRFARQPTTLQAPRKEP